jgi:hypothetical protein
MTEQNPNGSDDGFEVPARYLNINLIEIRPADISALLEKPINFVSPATDNFRITDLTHHDRWRPYRLSINKRHHVVLLNKDFAADKKALDYFLTILQRSVSLVQAAGTNEDPRTRYRIETDEKLLTGLKIHAPRLIERSTFCDLLNAELTYDRSRYRTVSALITAFCPKLQTHIEQAVINKFPKLENSAKNQSKNNPRNNHLKKNLSPTDAPPRSAMTEAFDKAKANKSDDKS